MPDQPMEERIQEALAKHGDWGYLIQSNEMFCKGCEWVKQLFLNEKSVDRFREHQAAVVAGIVREAMADAWAEGHESGFWNGRWSTGDTSELKAIGIEHAKANNPYRGEGA